MLKDECKIQFDEINNVISDIKVIEEQIEFFCKKGRIYKNYNKRISELEDVRKYLLMRLEYIINKNKNYHD